MSNSTLFIVCLFVAEQTDTPDPGPSTLQSLLSVEEEDLMLLTTVEKRKLVTRIVIGRCLNTLNLKKKDQLSYHRPCCFLM